MEDFKTAPHLDQIIVVVTAYRQVYNRRQEQDAEHEDEKNCDLAKK